MRYVLPTSEDELLDCCPDHPDAAIYGAGTSYPDGWFGCDVCGKAYPGPCADILDPDAPPSEPEDEDLTTTDHIHFWQNGYNVLVIEQGQKWETEVRKYLDACAFWPNVWFISDHGNAHLLSLTS